MTTLDVPPGYLCLACEKQIRQLRSPSELGDYCNACQFQVDQEAQHAALMELLTEDVTLLTSGEGDHDARVEAMGRILGWAATADEEETHLVARMAGLMAPWGGSF